MDSDVLYLKGMNHVKDYIMGSGSVGAAVRSWRKAKGLLQKQLAAEAGMEVAQLWALESDRNSPSMRTLARIAFALDISLAELLLPPPGNAATSIAMPKANIKKHLEMVEAVPIMRPVEKGKKVAKRDLERMEKSILNAAMAEAKFPTMAVTMIIIEAEVRIVWMDLL